MTAQQPHAHCDHECVCAVLAVDGVEGDKSPCDFSGCEHDTRSRPAQQPPGALACLLDEDRGIEGELSLKLEHGVLCKDGGVVSWKTIHSIFEKHRQQEIALLRGGEQK